MARGKTADARQDTGHREDYEQRANYYEHQAGRVTDPWIKEKYLALAKCCREPKVVPTSQDSRPRIAR
jgi:hypothetical protein